MKQSLIGFLAATLGALSLGAGSQRPETLPFYQSAEKTPEWIAAGSPEYAQIRRIGDFALTDQAGAMVTRATLKGRIHVASFFFTGCRQLCPKLQSNLAQVQREFRDDSMVEILSYSVTPERDDTAMLRRYGEANGVISGKWHLLTGPAPEIRGLARDSYFTQLPDSVNGAPNQLLHSETLVLVDGEGRVRGMYDGSQLFDVQRLMEDIHALR